MIAKTLCAATLLAVAGAAHAQSMSQTYLSNGSKVTEPNTTYASRGATGTLVSFNIGPNNSMDGPQGDSSNVVLLIDIASLAGFAPGTPVTMTGVGWDVNQQTVGASWLSEMRLYFDDAVAPDALGLFLRPSATSGTGGNLPEHNASAGIIDLSDNSIANIALPNGILRLELFESYEDVEDGVDGLWLDPSIITVAIAEVPTPGAMGLLGVAGMAALSRKRR